MTNIQINILWRVIIVLIGSIVAAAGLQYFLIPNHLLDGGVVGISIIASHVSGLPLGLYLIILNAPFIYLGYRKFGKYFASYSALGIILLALLTTLIHPEIGVTDDPMLAAVFGGILVGIGVGLVIRYGGTLDGTETVAILVDRVTTFSIGEVIMAINGVIFGLAGFVFGWENAMYSVIAYFVAHKAIDVTVEGLNESRSVWIVSRHHERIGDAITDEINRKVTQIKDTERGRGIALSVITRFEEQKVKGIIHSIDPKAFVVISNAHEIIGKDFTKDRNL